VSKYRVVLLNALPLNMFSEEWRNFSIQVQRVGIGFLRDYVERASEVKCYIRHPATIQLLSKLLQIELKPSAELYKYSMDDEVFIVTLKQPERGREATEVTEKDIEIYRIVAAPGFCL
jgi:hypothetical protein